MNDAKADTSFLITSEGRCIRKVKYDRVHSDGQVSGLHAAPYYRTSRIASKRGDHQDLGFGMRFEFQSSRNLPFSEGNMFVISVYDSPKPWFPRQPSHLRSVLALTRRILSGNPAIPALKNAQPPHRSQITIGNRFSAGIIPVSTRSGVME